MISKFSTKILPDLKTQKKDCVFCNIVDGSVQARIVFSDEISMGFLDRRPVFWGHCLLIPRDHYETIEDLPSEVIGPFFSNVKRLAIAVRRALEADGTFLGMNNKVSQSVPHVHVHVVPRKTKDGLRGFFWPRQKYENDEQEIRIQEAVRRELSPKETF
jgi:histidine triad (HIT) family protein